MSKIDVTLEELLEAGAHYGHQVRRWNPKMRDFIYGQEEGVHIFDLAKTREALLAALEVLAKAQKDGKVILFVGTKKQAKDPVMKVAQAANQPYVVERWLGGTLTNFEQIKRSVKNLNEMKQRMSSGEFAKFTKKERLDIAREIEKKDKLFGGLTLLTRLPDIVFILDTHREVTAVREAKRTGIESFGVTDSNSDPTEVTWPIPMNDDSNKSVNLVMELVRKAIMGSKSKRQSKSKVKK
ncbi:30S ribosomal protein S2 [Candidatus Woesebacteria bacterium]|nr:30S ribosomal protein S2 [Candidatus Woesebacteria bacterium]